MASPVVTTRSGRKVRRPARFEEEEDEQDKGGLSSSSENRPTEQQQPPQPDAAAMEGSSYNNSSPSLRRRRRAAAPAASSSSPTGRRRLDVELLRLEEEDEQDNPLPATGTARDALHSSNDGYNKEWHTEGGCSFEEEENWDDDLDKDLYDYYQGRGTYLDDDDLDDDPLDDDQVASRRSQRQRQAPYYYQSRHRPPTAWLLPANHRAKLVWDCLTLVLSFVNAVRTHCAIRDRHFRHSTASFSTFCDVWFVCDVLWNFFVERPIGNDMVLRDWRSVWARYLTTWFVVDALALVPGEVLYVQPLIDVQNRRGLLKKSVFRTRAVLRVTSALRHRHFRWFGQVAKHSKRTAGFGASRLLRLLIKYVPKYLLFFRNMKAVVAVRILRQVHWLRKVFWKRPFWKTWNSSSSSAGSVGKNDNTEDDTNSLTTHEEEEEDEPYDGLEDDQLVAASSLRRRRYWDWEFVDDDVDDDDGDPY